MILEHDTTLEQVKEYYGSRLKTSGDLKTNACCKTAALPVHLRPIAKQIDDEILQRSYGCGSPIPPELAGCAVLDLGCGTGRDAFIVSRLVGPEGRVIGVDMTAEQLEVANRHRAAQMERFGYATPNVEFRQAYIEDLAAADVQDASIDVVISNCVINLSPDKRRVFAEIFRVLKPGGELYFSDVFTGRRVPADLTSDPVLRGECLSGALYIEDFRRLLHEVGCADYRVLSSTHFEPGSAALESKVGMIDFYSLTIRAFKLDDLEDASEDYGQVAVYKGTLPESPHRFRLDEDHVFEAGRPERVCGNTASMLSRTRYAKHFDVSGDRRTHYGIFDDSSAADADRDPAGMGGACC